MSNDTHASPAVHDIRKQLNEAVENICEHVGRLESLSTGCSDHTALFGLAADIRNAGNMILSAIDKVAGSIESLALTVADTKLGD